MLCCISATCGQGGTWLLWAITLLYLFRRKTVWARSSSGGLPHWPPPRCQHVGLFCRQHCRAVHSPRVPRDTPWAEQMCRGFQWLTTHSLIFHHHAAVTLRGHHSTSCLSSFSQRAEQACLFVAALTSGFMYSMNATWLPGTTRQSNVTSFHMYKNADSSCDGCAF